MARLMRQRTMHEETVRRCQVGAYCRTLCVKRDLRGPPCARVLGQGEDEQAEVCETGSGSDKGRMWRLDFQWASGQEHARSKRRQRTIIGAAAAQQRGAASGCRRSSRRCMQWPGRTAVRASRQASSRAPGTGFRGAAGDAGSARQRQQSGSGRQASATQTTTRHQQKHHQACLLAGVLLVDGQDRWACSVWKQCSAGQGAAVVSAEVMQAALCKPRQGFASGLAGVGFERVWFANGRRGCLQRRNGGASRNRGLGRISTSCPSAVALQLSLYTGSNLQGRPAGQRHRLQLVADKFAAW